jgi:EAL domain-containing protein (putative c-di-GMP-specific phosphodiesterase class I)/putative methionine-R-sulfoxide reductase with GAF domain
MWVHTSPAFVRELLAPDGVRTVFQPLVRIADSRVIGYEALSRAAADATCPPDRWLADAEELGLKVEVELACLRAAASHGRPPGGALMFVNVSHRALLDPRFEEVRRLLPPHVLELTEHEPVEDYPQLIERLKPCLADGALLAIDDVGSGYASMAHVMRLTPAFLKIDRALIAGIDSNTQQRSLVAALVAFTRGTHATAIAEGVETGAELEVLRELQVDVVQGYLLARPAPPWVEPADTVLAHGATTAHDLDELAHAIARTVSAQAAADAVTHFIGADPRLLPSVYLERGGMLRCLSRQGQWLVLDGIPPGVGITGACHAAGSEILITDVCADERYRAAVPDVVAEVAVPLVVDRATVGVLNVDAVRPLTDIDVDAIRRCGELLAARLTSIGSDARRSSTLSELSRCAPWVSSGIGTAQVAHRVVASAVAVSGLQSAALWIYERNELRLAAVLGPEAAGLTALSAPQIDSLSSLAAEVTSCYSGGGVLDLAFGPTQVLRDRGISAMLLAPLRDGSRRVGLLCAISSVRTAVSTDTIEPMELLCLHAGSRLAAVRRTDRPGSRALREPAAPRAAVPLTSTDAHEALADLIR